MKREGKIKRSTSETNIDLSLKIDGSGKVDINTPIGFLNHMLTAMGKHALFDLSIKATGDIEVDDHHTVEDIGIVLGLAFKKAIEDKKGIKRFGCASVPMDEALCMASIDISGRPHFEYDKDAAKFEKGKIKVNGKTKYFDLQLIEEFFKAFVSSAEITLHIEIKRGKNLHHIYEAMFKSVARALYSACTIDERVKAIPSTKGIL